MYRWQDPAPEAVKAIRARRTWNGVRTTWHAPEQAAPAVPTMVIDGVEYVEAPETSWCSGCAFKGEEDSCFGAEKKSISIFGDDCRQRSVIYIRKA